MLRALGHHRLVEGADEKRGDSSGLSGAHLPRRGRWGRELVDRSTSHDRARGVHALRGAKPVPRLPRGVGASGVKDVTQLSAIVATDPVANVTIRSDPLGRSRTACGSLS